MMNVAPEMKWFRPFEPIDNEYQWRGVLRDLFPEEPIMDTQPFPRHRLAAMCVEYEGGEIPVAEDRHGGTFLYRAPHSVMIGSRFGSPRIDKSEWHSFSAAVYPARFSSHPSCFDADAHFPLVSKTTRLEVSPEKKTPKDADSSSPGSPVLDRRWLVFNECTTWPIVYPKAFSNLQWLPAEQMAVWHTRRIPGCPLSSLLMLSHHMNEECWLRIGRNLAQALRSLHDKGVTHGDVHAGNVLVDRYGRAAWIDFAYSRELRAESAPKRTRLATSIAAAIESARTDEIAYDWMRLCHSIQSFFEDRVDARRGMWLLLEGILLARRDVHGSQRIAYRNAWEKADQESWTKLRTDRNNQILAGFANDAAIKARYDTFWRVYDQQRATISARVAVVATESKTQLCFRPEGLQPYQHPDAQYYAHQLVAVLQLPRREGELPTDALARLPVRPMRVVAHLGWNNKLRSDGFANQYRAVGTTDTREDSVARSRKAVLPLRFSVNDGCLVRDTDRRDESRSTLMVPLVSWNAYLSQFELSLNRSTVRSHHLHVQLIHDIVNDRLCVMYDYQRLPETGARMLQLLNARIPGLPYPVVTHLNADELECKLVVEKHAGVPLAGLLRFGLSDVLQRSIAKSLGACIRGLHAAGWVHGRLFASKVLVDPRSAGVLVTGFHWARRPDATQTASCLAFPELRRRGWYDWLFTLEATLRFPTIHEALWAEAKLDKTVYTGEKDGESLSRLMGNRETQIWHEKHFRAAHEFLC